MAEDIERKRFEFALDRIEVLRNGGPAASKALEELPGLAVLLRTQGLLVAVAVLRARDGKAIADAIEAWLTRKAPNSTLHPNRENQEFLDLCARASRTAYLAAQWEAIELARCLKLVSEAVGTAKVAEQ